MDRRRLVATLALLAVVALAGCGERYETEVVCAGCADGPGEARGVTVTDSVTHVTLDGEGGARVEARMNLSGDGVEALRTDRERVRDTVEAVAEAGTLDEGASGDERTRSAFERRNLTGRMDGETFVVTYRVDNVSQRRLGTTLVDAFFRLDAEGREAESDYDDPFELGTDRLVVHAPEGTRPLVVPPNATDRGDRVVWTDGDVDPRSYVVFGSGSGLFARPAVAVETLGWAGERALPRAMGVTAPLLGLAGAFALSYPGRVTDGWAPREDRLLAAVALLEALFVATVAVAVFAVPGGAIVVMAVSLAALAVGGVALGRRYRSGWLSDRVRRLAGATPREWSAVGAMVDRRVGAVAAVLTVVAAVTAVVAADYRATVARPVAVAAGVVVLVSFPALARLVTRPGRAASRAAVVTAVAGAPWLLTLASVVESGAGETGGVLLPLLTGVVGLVACPLLFYWFLWLWTR